MGKSWREGGCHCGRVKWRALTPDRAEAERCNCSICSMTGFIHLIIPARDFELLSGEQELSEYRFHKKIAIHKFCSHCGIKSFYIPRSNPDGISLNVNCMDKESFEALEVTDFDGVNWEQNAARLAHKSD